MLDKKLRNDSTTEGKKIWEKVDRAAENAPQWVKDRLKGSEPPPTEKRAQGDQDK
ncbi:MAG: hypothetical protein WD773_09970 [Gemmatimonadales bacterium]